jgi:hypothetical protein
VPGGPRHGFLTVYHGIFRVPALYGAAQSLEALGDVAAARESYERVSRTWREAEPPLQLTAERARTAAARLGGGQ